RDRGGRGRPAGARGGGRGRAGAVLPVAPGPGPGGAVLPLAVRGVVVVQQRRDTGVHAEGDVTAMPAVTAVGAAKRFELLPPDGGRPIATVAAANMQRDAVDEGGHAGPFRENTRAERRSAAPLLKEKLSALRRQP